MADDLKTEWSKSSRRRHQEVATIDRLPPHHGESEQAVIGSILSDPKLIAELIEDNETSELFYDLRHQYLFDTMAAMYRDGIPIDLISVHERLRVENKLEMIGGLSYVSSLCDCVTSTANFEYWLRIIRDKYTLRKIIHTCTQVVATTYEREEVTEELLDTIERMMLGIATKGRVSNITPIKELVHQAIDDIEALHKRQGMLSGLPTGFPDLDKLTMGFQNADMIVIAARPSMGKTSLLMNIVEHIAIDNKTPCGIFSLEMKDRALVRRMLHSRARVNARSIRDGFLAERDFPKLTGAAGKIANAPIYIDRESGLNIMQVRARARRMVEQYGIKFLGIDYLQLLRGSQRRDKRHEEVADVSGGIKALAEELDIPVVVLSQLNRSVVKDKRARPTLEDLRESGAIEQDADVVGLLYRDKEEDDAPIHCEAMPCTLTIAKQRNGPTDDVKLTFLKAYTRFESAARVSHDDLPQGEDELPYSQYPDR